jgi:hypothetical protein
MQPLIEKTDPTNESPVSTRDMSGKVWEGLLPYAELMRLDKVGRYMSIVL